MASSRQMYSIIDEENAQGNIFCKQGSRNSAEHTTSAVDAVESELISLLQSESKKPCCKGGSGWFNILASEKLFKIITKATGLWNPRKKRYALLCAIFVVLNILSLLAEILIPIMCGPFVDGCVTHSKRVTNITNGTNNNNKSMAMFIKMYEITLAFDVWNAFCDTMTYILLVYTLWRVQRQLPSLSLDSSQTKVSAHEWLLINVMWIICSLAITVASAYQISVVEHSQMKFYGTYGSGILIVYLTAFTCCCVFVVLTCALGRLIDDCFQEICDMVHGNLNDVTAIHQKLVKQLSTASQSLNSWFIVHWVVFGIYCLAVFALNTIDFSMWSRFSQANNFFIAVAFVLNLAIFLVPCVYASRVTWKCEHLLFKVNNMGSEDWNEGHPFRERTNVNEFIFYAERSKCGFRIGNFAFGSSGTWISVILALLGLGVRLLAYFQ